MNFEAVSSVSSLCQSRKQLGIEVSKFERLSAGVDLVLQQT
jgi:hypothetical protein